MIPFVRQLEFEYGRADQVSPLIRRVIADNPGPFTFFGTGTYIVGHGQVAVIDPGPDMGEHLDAILAAVGDDTVSHILITHDHSDHSPLAAQLKAITGAKVYGCATAPSGAELLSRVSALPGFGEAKAKIFVALLGKQLGVRPPGWREAAGSFGDEGSYVSVADIVDDESLGKVRSYKQTLKAAAKSKAAKYDAG